MFLGLWLILQLQGQLLLAFGILTGFMMSPSGGRFLRGLSYGCICVCFCALRVYKKGAILQDLRFIILRRLQKSLNIQTYQTDVYILPKYDVPASELLAQLTKLTRDTHTFNFWLQNMPLRSTYSSLSVDQQFWINRFLTMMLHLLVCDFSTFSTMLVNFQPQVILAAGLLRDDLVGWFAGTGFPEHFEMR